MNTLKFIQNQENWFSLRKDRKYNMRLLGYSRSLRNFLNYNFLGGGLLVSYSLPSYIREDGTKGPFKNSPCDFIFTSRKQVADDDLFEFPKPIIRTKRPESPQQTRRRWDNEHREWKAKEDEIMKDMTADEKIAYISSKIDKLLQQWNKH